MLGDNQFADERGRRPQGRETDPRNAFATGEPGWSEQLNDEPAIDLASYWRLALKYRFLIAGCGFIIR